MGNMESTVKDVVNRYGKESSRMMDIVGDLQKELGFVADKTSALVAKELGVSKVDVDGVVTFYHFFSDKPLGQYAVYLNNSVVSMMKGMSGVARAFEKEAGCAFGESTADGKISLGYTSCIGMNDQEPAAIINGTVFTELNEASVKELVSMMKSGKDVADMVTASGDGKNQSELIKAMVNNNIRKKGQVLLADHETGAGLKKAVSIEPEAVIEEMKKANLRGRGGAGFPTGMKWEFTRKAEGDSRYVVCNADEGEPGTFKDRVILTEIPEMLFEGMAIGGYAIGAEKGILYLRKEYEYLKKYLESVLENMRAKNVLGKDAAGRGGFSFDIEIKLGAGAYICGEESALLESAEGKRGEPRNRPPFPAQKGYMDKPTTVNNVETYCCASRIFAEGSEWFTTMGTAQSAGTKLLSVSGDCDKPGIYEVEFGTTVQTLLEESGGREAQSVQVGGPSGTCISRDDFGRRICYDDLATGGSIIIIGPDRDLLEVAHNFMDFFVEESCGWCVPCRAGNVILKKKLEKIMSGNGTESDIADLESWGAIVKSMSRCGLGQTSPNPILTTIKNFRSLYDSKINKDTDYAVEFDLEKAVQDSCQAAGRKPNLHEH